MPTHLSLDDHLRGLARSGAALREAAAKAGLHAKVPTCPAWDVTKLVTHQGMVHRWAAASLRGDTDHDTSASRADANAAADLLGWYSDGLAALVDTVNATADDAKAKVFVFAGTAVQLYLSLWKRADEITTDGRADMVSQWRPLIRVRWS